MKTNNSKIVLFVFLFQISNLLTSQTYYEKGCLDFENENYSSAIFQFSKSINSGENLAESYMMRAASLCEKKEYLNSLIDVDSSLAIDSTQYKTYYYKGRIYLLNGFSSIALKNLNKAVSINPVDSKSYNCRATAKMVLNDSIGALEDANRAIRLDSTNSLFYVNRGFIKSNLNRYNEAILDYNKSLQIKESQGGFANRGFAFFKLKQYDKAIEDFNKSLFIIPKDWEILYYRGLSYIAEGKKNEACRDFSLSAELGGKKAK
ncbi:MAG: hypothetical protein H0U27_02885 [Nitrosopumilus sp.]|nr:hypothetical protein [Nitrosopumilus sp.]